MNVALLPRQRRQHLLGIARRRLVRLPAPRRVRRCRTVRLAHAHRPDVLAGMRRCRVHPQREAVLQEIPVLVRRATVSPHASPSATNARPPAAAPPGPGPSPSSRRTARPRCRRVVISRCACQLLDPRRCLRRRPPLPRAPCAARARRAAPRAPSRRSAARQTTAPARSGPRS